MLSSPSSRASAWLLLLLAAYAIGVGLRREVYQAQVEALGEPPPFTLESALHFRLLETVDRLGSIPEKDPRVEYPSGIRPHETYTLGAEYLVAPLARALPDAWPLEEKVRWIMVLWFCLGIPFLGLYVRWAFDSRLAGGVAALLYAVSLASVIRSTGQEISRENFALPLLAAHLAARALAERAGRREISWAAAAVSGVFLAGALWTWDLIQYYLYLWGGVIAVQSLFGREGARARRRRRVWACCGVGLLGVGWINPYFQSHHLLTSPILLFVYGVALLHAVRPSVWPCSATVRRLAATAILLSPLALGFILPNDYADQYGHFSELLSAKITHLNQKPADPSELSFSQRIMWVPALHSPTWGLTQTLFPTMVWLVFAGVGIYILRAVKRRTTLPELAELLFFVAASAVTFFFFVRFHVFTVLFGAAWVGAWVATARRSGRWLRMCLILILSGCMGLEAARVLDRPERWGRPGLYVQELRELTDWMTTHAAGQAVLANFGLSASLLAEAGTPIVLHPKFESPEIRERVRVYGEKLFKGTEAEFRDWADSMGVEWYVHSMGEFASLAPERQMRYFVDALEPPEFAAARIFEFAPGDAELFTLRWSNRKYRVFNMITRRDEMQAEALCVESRAAFERGQLEEAEAHAVKALQRVPDAACAKELLKHVLVLRDAGFRVPQTLEESP